MQPSTRGDSGLACAGRAGRMGVTPTRAMVRGAEHAAAAWQRGGDGRAVLAHRTGIGPFRGRHPGTAGTRRPARPHPDRLSLGGDAENQVRLRLLTGHRGYASRTDYFEGFPDDVSWQWMAITAAELAAVRYIDYDYWIELSGGTRLAADAAPRIRAGAAPFGVSSDGMLRMAQQVTAGTRLPRSSWSAPGPAAPWWYGKATPGSRPTCSSPTRCHPNWRSWPASRPRSPAGDAGNPPAESATLAWVTSAVAGQIERDRLPARSDHPGLHRAAGSESPACPRSAGSHRPWPCRTIRSTAGHGAGMCHAMASQVANWARSSLPRPVDAMARTVSRTMGWWRVCWGAILRARPRQRRAAGESPVM